MSISTEIDYRLLNQYFELGTYDSLIKSDLAAAITARYERIAFDEKINQFEREFQLKRLIEE